MEALLDAWAGIARDPAFIAVAASLCGVLVGWKLARKLEVPFDADRYFPLTKPKETLLRGAMEKCNAIQDNTTRCYFKGRIREMVRLEPICDASEFAKMSKDLHAEVEDCLEFGTCFRYAGPAVKWDISGLPRGPHALRASAEMAADIKRIQRVLCRLAKRYGKVFPMQLPGNPLWVVVSGAKEAKAIFHDNGATVSSRTFGQAHLIAHTDFPAGNFLRCPFSEDLKKRRGVVWREALSQQKVGLFRPLLERCRHFSVRAFLLAAEKGSPFSPRPFLRMSYLNTLICIIFGISFTDTEDPAYKRVYDFVDGEANEPLVGEADICAALRFTPFHTRKAARMKSIREREDAWLHEQIQARQEHLAKAGEPQTLCDILLQSMESPCPGQRLSYENVKEICNEIIFAGTDTTATTTETVLAHLLNNPDKAAKLRAELDDVFGESQRMPCAEDFPKLKYTNAVIKESMRLTCAVPMNGHTCSADTEVLGYRIPKGALCINNIYAVHYDPEIYPDPERFEPERWLASGDPCHWGVEHSFEFMPFGIGRRLCLGYNLAIENLQLFVASLFLSFEFSTPNGKPVSMEEVMDFTVSIPEFQVCAGVREHAAVGQQRAHWRSLPSSELVGLGSKDAISSPPGACGTKSPGPARERWALWCGSQTGTAEAFAKALAQAAGRRGVECAVRSLETAVSASGCDLRPEGEVKVIFVAATFGNGEPTDNAAAFHAWLRSGAADLQGLEYAVFGLGNSAYEHYNAMGKYVDAQLASMGGVRLDGVPLGLGDASKDLEGAFDEWMSKLLEMQAPVHCATSAGAKDVDSPCDMSGQWSSWKVLWQPDTKATCGLLPTAQLQRRSSRICQLADAATTAHILNVRQLADNTDNGSIVEVILDLAGTKATYGTADTIGVFPRNNPKCVELFAAMLNQPLDSSFALAPTDATASGELPFPCPTTLREVLSASVDLLGKPTKRLVAELARFCSDEGERQDLLLLASPAGKAQWEDQASAKRISLLELFSKYRSLSAIPLASFLELALQLRLKPRYYTASSCPEALGADRVALTLKVLEDRCLVPGDPRAMAFGGVGSSFLAAALPGDAVQMFVQPSGFKLPRDPELPVVMVAAGTGLAPFRGFLQERRVLQESGTRLGEALLFFGCTRRGVDFICEAELSEHLQRGTLTELVLAFSREDPRRKTYVQHRLVENGDKVLGAIREKRGHFYVCGGIAMGRGVKEALVGLLSAQSPTPGAEVAEMQRDGRYVAELWA